MLDSLGFIYGTSREMMDARMEFYTDRTGRKGRSRGGGESG